MTRHRESATLSQCTQCGYDLRNLETPRCPECGLSFEDNLTHWSRRQKTLYPLIFFLVVGFLLLVNVAWELVTVAGPRPPAWFHWLNMVAGLNCLAFLLASPGAIISGVRGQMCRASGLFVLSVVGAAITALAIFLSVVLEPPGFADAAEKLLGNTNMGLFGLIVFYFAARYYGRRRHV